MKKAASSDVAFFYDESSVLPQKAVPRVFSAPVQQILVFA
jgi:hypothetical protein